MDDADRSGNTEGRQEFAIALRLTWIATLVMIAQELLLYLRPTPYGGPYVTHWPTYFRDACLYVLLATLLVSLPMLWWSLVRYYAPVKPTTARRLQALHTTLLMLVVALDHADNEVMRFMGTHLTVQLVQTYGNVRAWGADMGHILTSDRGGPLLPFVILLLGPAAVWWASRRPHPPRFLTRSRRLGTALVVVPLLALLLKYNQPTHIFRRERVKPELITLALELSEDLHEGIQPTQYAKLVSSYQRHWLAEDGDSGWTFGSKPDYPLLRTPRTPSIPDSAGRWNVIYLQLETFRGWNVGFLHPEVHPSPTPFLDSLAHSVHAAYWTRHLSFGPPTVSGFIAGHCSIRPHSRQNITTTFTYTGLDCLPEVLRRLGWFTTYLTPSDPDWDNQTIWLKRWYDEHTYYIEADEDDRTSFHTASEHLKEVGRRGKPFFATVVSISNHYPFRSRDPEHDIASPDSVQTAILNTMHYTDQAVQDLVNSLQSEPWFKHTLIVVVGDHGYNLGEHDGTPGQRNGYRESLWVPLIIVGDHPRLPHGAQTDVASLLDVAPTLADLLGVRVTTSWMGHSLVTATPPHQTVTGSHLPQIFAESGLYSLVVHPTSGELQLFDPLTDPLQTSNLVAVHPDTALALARRTEDERKLSDYLIETDRVWPKQDQSKP